MDICVVCLENNGEMSSRIDISSNKWKGSNMQHIIEKHLWWWCLRQPINKHHKQWICQECWQELTTFYYFAKRVKKAHKVYRVSMKKNPVQVLNEDDPNKLIVAEQGSVVGNDREPTIMTEELPLLIPLTNSLKRKQIQTEGFNIEHFRNVPNVDMTEYSQEDQTQKNEEILPNFEYSVTDVSDSLQFSDKSMDYTLTDIKSLLHQQDSLNKNICMGIAELKRTVGKQNSAFTNVLANQISALKTSFQSHFEDPKFTTLFPISTEEELHAFENTITDENKSEIVSSVKRIIGPKGIEKGMCHIFSNELILEYNVNGISGKKRLMDYDKTMKVLFLASASDSNISLVEFHVQLRKAIKAAKNRYFQAECVKRKRYSDKDSTFEMFDEENSQSVQNEPGCSTYN